MATGEPLTWETSADSKPEVAATLPESVASCLQNAKYLHLATCTQNRPHVSLMNYTYIPQHPFSSDASSALPSGPIIVMTTNPSSRKTQNLVANPNVSLLVHDWVSSRPPQARGGQSPPLEAAQQPSSSGGRPGGGEGRSSLASLLMGMNSSEMGSISATINGTARVLDRGGEVETWCKEQHLRFNGFDDRAATNSKSTASIEQLSGSPNTAFHAPPPQTNGTSESEDNEVRVVVVSITDGRIADHKGGVRDFVLAGSTTAHGRT